MRNNDRENIRRLLKRLGRDFSTENHITFVAENTGLLQSCRNILSAEREGRQETIEWLKDACVENGVAYPHCLQEIGRILQLFQPGIEQDQHYAELGLTADASEEEVKRAYRRLSMKYHPDTAGKTDEATTGKFIRLTRAYHAIVAGEEAVADAVPAASGPPSWSYGKREKGFTGRLSPRLVLGVVLLAGALIAACLVVSEMYSRKVMLSSLHNGGAAFIPPARKGQQENSQENMTFAEKLRSTREADVVQQSAGVDGKTEVVAAVVADENVFSRQPKPAIPGKESRAIDEGRHKISVEGRAGDSSVEIGTADQEEESTGGSLMAQAVVVKESVDGAGGSVEAAIPYTEQSQRRTPDQHEANTTSRIEEEPVSGDQQDSGVPDAVVETSTSNGEDEPRPASARVEELPGVKDAGTVKAEKKESNKKTPSRQMVKEQSPPAVDTVTGQQDNMAVQAPDTPAPAQSAVEKAPPPAVAHAGVMQENQEKPEDALQTKIDIFLRDYSAAYGQKNMVGFLQFFNDDATENGKPVVDLIPTYAQLFEETESIVLQISALRWQETAKDRIALQCSFKIDLAYRNANAVHGTGKIDFRLEKDGSAMKIQQMTYSFDQ